MSYIPQTSEDILKDIYSRAEFYNLKDVNTHKEENNIEHNENLDISSYLQLRSYQTFVVNFISPDTPYNRLLMKHNTGSGKTITSISLSFKFIEYFKKQETNIGSVFVISFEGARKSFQKDLFKYPQFGFVDKTEMINWISLRQKSNESDEDYKKLIDYSNKMKRRLTNRTGNGYFVFIGYKELVNKLFIIKHNISDYSEDEIKKGIENKTIQINKTFLSSFENSLMICDEIHNVYNSISKNNWGIAIQYLIDNVPSLKCLYLSATPINNNPSEIVDILNLLVPIDQRIQKKDLFENNTLKGDALSIISKLSKGRVSYLLEKNIKYFPSKSFIGEEIEGIKYLKFVRTTMGDLQFSEYKKINHETLNFDDKYLLDFVIPHPSNNNVGIFRKNDMKIIKNAPPKWKLENGIVFDEKLSGPCLTSPLLAKISTKYNKMIIDLMALLKNKKGKTLIYHNNVNMSGVMLISEILLMNGFINDNIPFNSNTLCSLCGNINSAHVDDSCVFKPARFILLHGGIDKQNIDIYMDRFRSNLNNNGEEYFVLIGSKIIKESYDFNCIRNLFVMSRPDNISTLIQIIGRAVRNKSHTVLPLEDQHVNISLYTSCLPNKELSYEELKYKLKIEDYLLIQKIEKIFHEYSVDNNINYRIIKPGLEDNTIGDLKYVPVLNEYTIDKINYDTFNHDNEINLVLYIIKRAFIEVSKVWKFDDLVTFVRNPTFDVEYNTKNILISSITIGLTKLLEFVSGENKEIDNIKSLFNNTDNRIISRGQICKISQIGEYYISQPIEEKNIYSIDSPFRNRLDKNEVLYIDIKKYLESSVSLINYEEKKNKFKNIYEKIEIENMSNAICMFGIDFHIIFIEECIEYIVGFMIRSKTVKSDFHLFYFKMLYYYDILDLILFADSVKEYIYNQYVDYIFDQDEQDDKNKNEKIDRDCRNNVNFLTRQITKSNCTWCPYNVKNAYNSSVKLVLKKISESKNEKIISSLFPVGHCLRKTPYFYHPVKKWFMSQEYLIDNTEWVENPIIIGYNTKTKTGIYTKFKLRNPVNEKKTYTDHRQIEKGALCSSKNRNYLEDICEKLEIEFKDNESVIEICELIKNKLIYLEILERTNGTNIKFFYNHYELN